MDTLILDMSSVGRCSMRSRCVPTAIANDTSGKGGKKKGGGEISATSISTVSILEVGNGVRNEACITSHQEHSSWRIVRWPACSTCLHDSMQKAKIAKTYCCRARRTEGHICSSVCLIMPRFSSWSFVKRLDLIDQDRGCHPPQQGPLA